MTTTYRESCGTHIGMLLHQTAGEKPCGTCTTAEAWRLIYPETVPQRPAPRPSDPTPGITADQAAANARELLAATEDGRRHLRALDGAA